MKVMGTGKEREKYNYISKYKNISRYFLAQIGKGIYWEEV